MQKGLKAYNKLMFHLAMEYDTIGTVYSERPDDRNNWNLRDMVSEAQYILDIYLDSNCIYYECAHNGDKEEYNQWKNDVARIRRFIARYKDEALTMQCYEGHCSKFD